MSRKLLNSAAVAALFACAAACTSSIQTTSGTDYMNRAESSGAVLSDEFRRVADVEPMLSFPARIGIARIKGGKLTNIPEEEFFRWTTAFGDDGNTYLPVSLFIADLVAPEDLFASDADSRRRTVIERLKLSGARQHMDAILVYEVDAVGERRANGLALANLSIIGLFIAPSSAVSASAIASGLLFDVRNGYPYAQLSTTTDKADLTPLIHAADRKSDLEAKSIELAVEKLSQEASSVMRSLRAELTSGRTDS